MNDVLRLERIDFDELENREPTRTRVIGIFCGDERKTAHGKAAEWFRAQPPMRIFLGHDGDVYPKFRLVKDRDLGGKVLP